MPGHPLVSHQHVWCASWRLIRTVNERRSAQLSTSPERIKEFRKSVAGRESTRREIMLQLNPTYADGKKTRCFFFFFFYIPFHFLLLLATLTVMFAIFPFFPHCWWCPWAQLSWLSPMPPPLLLCWMSSAHVADRRALYNIIIIIILSDKVKVSSYFCFYK